MQQAQLQGAVSMQPLLSPGSPMQLAASSGVSPLDIMLLPQQQSSQTLLGPQQVVAGQQTVYAGLPMQQGAWPLQNQPFQLQQPAQQQALQLPLPARQLALQPPQPQQQLALQLQQSQQQQLVLQPAQLPPLQQLSPAAMATLAQAAARRGISPQQLMALLQQRQAAMQGVGAAALGMSTLQAPTQQQMQTAPQQMQPPRRQQPQAPVLGQQPQARFGAGWAAASQPGVLVPTGMQLPALNAQQAQQFEQLLRQQQVKVGDLLGPWGLLLCSAVLLNLDGRSTPCWLSNKEVVLLLQHQPLPVQQPLLLSAGAAATGCSVRPTAVCQAPDHRAVFTAAFPAVSPARSQNTFKNDCSLTR